MYPGGADRAAGDLVAVARDAALPRRLVFPPLRLLLGLSGKEETPARTPWWLLLLRLIATAAVIVALAEPMFGKGPQIAGTGPVVLFVDNGWTAAANWDARAGGDRRRAAQRDAQGAPSPSCRRPMCPM